MIEGKGMSNEKGKTINYANWVSVKMIVVPAILALAFTLLSLKLWGLAFAASLFLLIAVYFALARLIFSPHGDDVQAKIEGLVLDHLLEVQSGTVLDIGCGNGPLTIAVAKKYSQAHVTGIDTWGKNWDYSQKLCERNAASAGVSERVSFQKGSAIQLPFADGQFDLEVSNLVFHEISGLKDKREAVREALRVLKPGGTFVLQDLFLIKAYYGKLDELIKAVRGWGIQEVEFIRTCDEPFIPKLVKLPFMVGTLGLIKGIK